MQRLVIDLFDSSNEAVRAAGQPASLNHADGHLDFERMRPDLSPDLA
jgi:hypothetical protein